MTDEGADAHALGEALLPIIEQALGMKSRADHGAVIRLTEAEINAGLDALRAAGMWIERVWERGG